MTNKRLTGNQNGKLCFMVELVDAPGNIVPTVLETWEEVIAYLAKCGEPKAIGSNGFTVRVCYFHGRMVQE